MNKDMISIIVPVYNMKEYLGRCVDSLLAQTYENLQILLVDDGSTDGSDLLCKEMAKKDARISAIQIEHAGPGAARNCGIRESKGEYVAFVDSDDWIDPRMMETMHKVMIRRNADLVTCDLIRTAEETPSFDGKLKGPLKTECFTQEEFMRVFFRIGSNEWVHHPVAKLYKREYLNGELYPEGIFIGEDVMSTFKVLMQTQKVVHISRVFYYYYENPHSATSRFSQKDFDLLRVWDGVLKTCKEQGKYYSYAKLNRERINYTLLMRMALAVPYGQILKQYGDEYRELYRELQESEKLLLSAPIPLSRKITIAIMCRDYRLLCSAASLYRAGKKAADRIGKRNKKEIKEKRK